MEWEEAFIKGVVVTINIFGFLMIMALIARIIWGD